MSYNLPKGSQALILPINKCSFSAGYKSKIYQQQQGYNHYGVDLFSFQGVQKVYACGDGEVVAAGCDGKNGIYSGCGNVIVIIYKNVYIPAFEKVMDITCRMFHFETILVKKGQKVNKDTVIGMYGNTGGATVNGKPMGKHLHIEFDTDTKYPLATVGISGTYNQILTVGTVDSTVNPSDVWFIKKSAPDNQEIKGAYSGWYTNNDIQLPSYDDIKWVEETEEPSIPSQNKTFYGIDVSYAQGNSIDWAKVKQTNEFVMCRIGWIDSDGNLNVDKTFHNNATKAYVAGLKVGGYIYSYALSVNAAKKGAQATIAELKNHTIEYPIAFDVEDPYISNLLVSQLSDICAAFCSEVEKLGYYSMIYANKSWLENKLDMTKLKAYDVWLAQWASKPTYKGNFGIWQFVGSEGRVNGVNGACDRDIAYQDYATIIRNAGLNNLKKPTPEQPTELEKLKEENEVLKKELESTKNALKIKTQENIELSNCIRNIKQLVEKY